MIDAVEITNFKSIRHQKIDLERLTVFVGPNGSGKTSVLEALGLAVSATTVDAAKLSLEAFSGQNHCDWVYTRNGNGELKLGFSIGKESYQLSAQSRYGDATPSTSIKPGVHTWKVTRSGNPRLPDPALNLLKLNLSARACAKPSYSVTVPPSMDSQGEGLASVAAYMRLNDPDAFDDLVEQFRELIPQVKRIRFTKSAISVSEKFTDQAGSGKIERVVDRVYQGDALLFDFVGASGVAAHTVSEGTLLVLGLLTAILGSGKPDLLLLDDLDRGLHPLAQRNLVDVLRKIMGRFPNLQIIATTHSPYLLDCLRPEEVRLMTIGEDGYSVCGKLSDHPEFDKWKDEMAPGELWSLFGEKWLAEGAAAK